MRSVSATELLDIWESGLDGGPVEQALAMLIAAAPGTAADVLRRLNVGERDALLLDLYETVFGSELAGVAECPRCRSRAEAVFSVADVRAPRSRACDEVISLRSGPYTVHFRLPDSSDLLAVSTCRDVATGRALLLARCVVDARSEGKEVNAGELPNEVCSAISVEMERLAPQACFRIILVCPECSQAFTRLFDVATLLWQQLRGWAHRTIYEVHLLASTYGWSEHEILQMSAYRRQAYITWASK